MKKNWKVNEEALEGELGSASVTQQQAHLGNPQPFKKFACGIVDGVNFDFKMCIKV